MRHLYFNPRIHRTVSRNHSGSSLGAISGLIGLTAAQEFEGGLNGGQGFLLGLLLYVVGTIALYFAQRFLASSVKAKSRHQRSNEEDK